MTTTFRGDERAPSASTRSRLPSLSRSNSIRAAVHFNGIDFANRLVVLASVLASSSDDDDDRDDYDGRVAIVSVDTSSGEARGSQRGRRGEETRRISVGTNSTGGAKKTLRAGKMMRSERNFTCGVGHKDHGHDRSDKDGTLSFFDDYHHRSSQKNRVARNQRDKRHLQRPLSFPRR